MSRIKVRDLVTQAKRLQTITHRLELRWLQIHRIYKEKLHAIEEKSAKRLKQLNETLEKLKHSGFVTKIYNRTGKKR